MKCVELFLKALKAQMTLKAKARLKQTFVISHIFLFEYKIQNGHENSLNEVTKH